MHFNLGGLPKCNSQLINLTLARFKPKLKVQVVLNLLRWSRSQA